MKTPFSYWEDKSFARSWDVIIIGAGLIGMQSARFLLQRHPSLKVLILERGYLPHGASTRNAGFACFGSLSELIAHEEKEGTGPMMDLVRKRYNGLKLLRQTVPDDLMTYEELGGFELFTPADSDSWSGCLKQLARYNDLMKPVTGLPDTYRLVTEQASSFGFDGVSGLIQNQAEGQLDTGKLMHFLWMETTRSGAMILGGAPVQSVQSGVVPLSDGGRFYAGTILVTTNAFTRQLLPSLDVIPGRGQVLVTDPIPGLKVRGAFHYEDGFYYFRDVGGRLLLGGGRNLDFKAEETTDFALTDLVQNRLKHLLKSVILPGKEVTIGYQWSGIMAFGAEKAPIIAEVDRNVWVAVRMSGMGVAIGTGVAKEVTDRMTV